VRWAMTGGCQEPILDQTDTQQAGVNC
jgi:hypothetical protein